MGFRTFVRRHTTRGVRAALRNLIVELRLQERHRRGRRRARRLAHARELRIQLGSGRSPRPGWINVDLFAPDADLPIDLREELPFATGSAAVVYAEHVLEHFEYPGEVQRLLREIHRVLKPSGVFSLVVPDAGRALRAYAEADEAFFRGRRRRSYLATERPTRMHHVNYLFRQDGQHKYAYDEETLAQVLEAAGFVDVRRREFDPALDSERRHSVYSLYMQASTPSPSAARLGGAAAGA